MNHTHYQIFQGPYLLRPMREVSGYAEIRKTPLSTYQSSFEPARGLKVSDHWRLVVTHFPRFSLPHSLFPLNIFQIQWWLQSYERWRPTPMSKVIDTVIEMHFCRAQKRAEEATGMWTSVFPSFSLHPSVLLLPSPLAISFPSLSIPLIHYQVEQHLVIGLRLKTQNMSFYFA